MPDCEVRKPSTLLPLSSLEFKNSAFGLSLHTNPSKNVSELLHGPGIYSKDRPGYREFSCTFPLKNYPLNVLVNALP
jgi:hypothetical protein